MATIESLISLLTQPESAFLERKLQTVNPRIIRRTVVAFANSLTAGEEAVLFIGVRDDGSIEGCSNPDSLQKAVREICDEQCYPSLTHKIFVLHEANNAIAVVVVGDQNGPHFAGPAFVRRGSSSVVASQHVFNELVYSRNSKAAALIKMKNNHTIIRLTGSRYGREEGRRLMVGSVPSVECKVSECNANFVTFATLATGEKISQPLESVSISYDHEKWCPRIVVTEP